jgi:predicted NAD/FAD-binding protein
MNRLQSLRAERDYLVSINRTEMVDPDRVIRVIDYAHPVFTPGGVHAQARWAEISGVRHTHFCGAYWGWGFHEDGAWSALRVSEALGGRGPLRRPGRPAEQVARYELGQAA